MSEAATAPRSWDKGAPPGPVPAQVKPPPSPPAPEQLPGEINGPRGPEPTRFGDWEKGGRCTDF